MSSGNGPAAAGRGRDPSQRWGRLDKFVESSDSCLTGGFFCVLILVRLIE
jgi:hypothetical protein